MESEITREQIFKKIRDELPFFKSENYAEFGLNTI